MKNEVLFCIVFVLAFLSCKDRSDSIVSIKDKRVVNELIPLNSSVNQHFRGIQALSDEVIWLSGTEGSVLLTLDGGKTWENRTVSGCDSLDFRDIHAIDSKRAWVMSSGNGVKVYHTKNGGLNWSLQFEDSNPKVFLDGMDFSDEKNGVIYGDPINGCMDVLMTSDGGLVWSRIQTELMPKAIEGEAGFAASGTGVVFKDSVIWMATGGGEISRIIKSLDKGKTWEVYDTPIKGGEGKGIFSLAMKDNQNGIAVGGDYIDSTNVEYICSYTADGGKTWKLVEHDGPQGYRSCVAISDSGLTAACGRTGIDITNDFRHWESVSTEGYFTCDFGQDYLWLAGRSGKVAKMLTKN